MKQMAIPAAASRPVPLMRHGLHGNLPSTSSLAMKISLAVIAALLAVSRPVWADCLPSIEGSVEATFRVDSCGTVKAPRPDRRPLIRLSVSELNVRASPGPGDSEELVSYYDQYAANVSHTRHLFVDGAGGETCMDFPSGTEHSAVVEVLCCDTIPQKGACALSGPLVRPN